MAVNILDAFIVTFGIDRRDYEAGQREIRDGNKRLREDNKRTFDDLEGRSKSAGLSFRSLSNELAGLVLLFAGAKSVGDFASRLLHGEAAAGRLSQTLGVATSRLVAWQETVKQVGGQPGDADAALQSIEGAVQSYKLTGTTGMDADLRGLGVTNSDLMSKDPSQILLKIAQASDRMSKPEFAARLQRIGLPQSAIYLLEQGRQKLEAQLKVSERLSHVTEQDAKAAQQFEAQLAKLQTTIEGKVRPFLTRLIEALDRLLSNKQGMQEFTTVVATGLGAIAGAAALANIGFVALAGSIAAVIIAYRDWERLRNMSPEDRRAFEQRGSDLRQQGWDALRRGDIGGFLGTLGEGFSERAFGNGGLGNVLPSAPRPSSDAQDSQILQTLMAAGIPGKTAMGILAGIRAEGGGVGYSANGAFGIGQWRGDRLKRLFNTFGFHPGMTQQLSFLISELKGGDRGGAAVLRQGDPMSALMAYITQFMRPAAGPETWGDVARGKGYLQRHAYSQGGNTTIGNITIHTRATDAKGIAHDMRRELHRRGTVTQTDSGVTN